MRDVMVDLETLGNSPGAAILSIGAVAFDPETGEMDDDGFYTVVNTNSCVCAGLRFDQGTLDWWREQSDEARQVLKEAMSPKAPTLKNALIAFNGYLYARGKDVRVWGNGSDFDNALLAVAYRAADVTPGWKFWNSRCFRTLKNLSPGTTVQRLGTYHNALDDARTQAAHALRIFAELRGQGARPKEIVNTITLKVDASKALESVGQALARVSDLIPDAEDEDLVG